jgi:hypothetical protein
MGQNSIILGFSVWTLPHFFFIIIFWKQILNLKKCKNWPIYGQEKKIYKTKEIQRYSLLNIFDRFIKEVISKTYI